MEHCDAWLLLGMRAPCPVVEWFEFGTTVKNTKNIMALGAMHHEPLHIVTYSSLEFSPCVCTVARSCYACRYTAAECVRFDGIVNAPIYIRV